MQQSIQSTAQNNFQPLMAHQESNNTQVRYNVLTILEKIFDEYKNEFIYIKKDDIQFAKNSISGHLKYTGAGYMTIYSKILNNTEAMFIFNQLQYILMTALFLEDGSIEVHDLKAAYAKLDGIVYKNMTFEFKRSITSNDELDYHCSVEKLFDNKGRPYYEITLDLHDGAFIVKGTAIALNKSIHKEGTA